MKRQKLGGDRASTNHRIKNALLAGGGPSSADKIIERIKTLLVEAAEDWFTGTVNQEPGHIRYRANLLDASESSDNWKGLIDSAKSGDHDADAVLCGKAALLIENGKKIEDPLAEYISSKLYDRFFARKSVRGRDGTANAARDMFILAWVSTLQRHGFHPTRNDASRDKAGKVSGCALVTEVLNKIDFNIDERGVEQVWRKRISKQGLRID